MDGLSNPKTILGIDIGTSSVKVSILRLSTPTSYSLLSSGKAPYDPSRIRKSPNPSYSQQNVQEILTCLQVALNEASVSAYQLDLIGICGQMHGVVLWNQTTLYNQDGCLDYASISDQYDWTDGRCSADFLATLPRPESSADTISTGYGIATLFWLAKYEPEFLKRFNRAATIMDFFASILCNLEEVNISAHNANNWGYFDPETETWNTQLLQKSGFPIHLLPRIVPLNTVVGKSSNWSGIAANIPVLVSYGDLQAIMTLAFLKDDQVLVLNMGTSAQLVYLEPPGFKPEKKSISKRKAVDYMPFGPGRYLALAAGLNGGNVLREYVAMLQNIVESLTGAHLSEAQVWSRLSTLCETSTPTEEQESNFTIQPTLFGERHQPKPDLQLSGIAFEFPKLPQLTVKLCASLLENLFDMIDFSREEAGKRQKLVCTGTVLMKNQVLQRVLPKVLKNRGFTKLQIEYLDACDADVGCALLAARQYYPNETLGNTFTNSLQRLPTE